MSRNDRVTTEPLSAVKLDGTLYNAMWPTGVVEGTGRIVCRAGSIKRIGVRPSEMDMGWVE